MSANGNTLEPPKYGEMKDAVGLGNHPAEPWSASQAVTIADLQARVTALENTPPIPVQFENPWTPTAIGAVLIALIIFGTASAAILRAIGIL